MKVYLVDGTYELFRSYFALPPLVAPDGRPVGAVRGVVQSLLYLLREEEVTHIGCAFDRVVESFRNQMFVGYKTGGGTPEDLLTQFELVERAVESLGILVWPMIEFEADDALATAAAANGLLLEVEQVVICSPDKDLAQMVRDDSVVCYDRRREKVMNEAGVVEKFGVSPRSIPDLLALTLECLDSFQEACTLLFVQPQALPHHLGHARVNCLFQLSPVTTLPSTSHRRATLSLERHHHR